jgi:hypothetical protein
VPPQVQRFVRGVERARVRKRGRRAEERYMMRFCKTS